MRPKLIVILSAAGMFLFMPASEARAWRGGGGGFHAGGGRGTSFHAGGFGGGYGSVHHAGATHYGPATGLTHVGGTSVQGMGGTARYGGATHVGAGGVQHYSGAGYTSRYNNYGSIQHYDVNYRAGGAYGGAVYHGPAGGTAAAYRGPYSSGAVVRGPAGYGAAAVHGPAGGTAVAYRGPYGAGAVAHLPSGYTATAWRGTSYYHSGYSFYHPTWYGGTVSYVPVYPPIGFFFASLPSGATQTVVNNNTYYVSDGVYYQSTTQDGQQGYAVAENPAPQPAPSAGSAPDPLQLLKKMSDYMGREAQLKMTVDETFDEVLATGQKIQMSNQRVIQVKRPDKIAVDVNGAGIQRRIVCDGNNFTAIDLAKNAYTTIPMNGSLDSVMEQLAQRYGMAQPVEDLLYSDIYGRLSGKIVSAQFLGAEDIAGHNCNHLAFTQAGLSWQIWIEAAGQPVPRKVVITYDSTPGRPQYTLTISQWGAPDGVPDSAFQVDIPPNAVPASLASLTGQPVGNQ